MPVLITASTSPGAGNTALTAGLATILSSDSRTATAATAWSDGEESSLPATLGEQASARPLGRSAATTAEIAAAAKSVVEPGAITIIEGKPGDSAANLALAEELDALVVLVARESDDILPAASSYGTRLAGVVINAVSQYRRHEVESRIIPALKQANIRVLGWLPEDRRLVAPTVGLVAETLSGEFILNEEESGRLIDNFLIGGMVLDWGPFYFGSQENVGVIVRGDRPDIQLAALQTETVKAMILTKGVRPVEYVLYEASQLGVPIVLADGSTEQVAEKLESVLAATHFDHPGKLERMVELVRERVDIEALESALSLPATR